MKGENIKYKKRTCVWEKDIHFEDWERIYLTFPAHLNMQSQRTSATIKIQGVFIFVCDSFVLGAGHIHLKTFKENQ